ncbi:hypothetical protein [Metallosphaera yellowstonensis]|nr:hypothetical protein [Metallosphaera yellowstonensis]
MRVGEVSRVLKFPSISPATCRVTVTIPRMGARGGIKSIKEGKLRHG